MLTRNVCTTFVQEILKLKTNLTGLCIHTHTHSSFTPCMLVDPGRLIYPPPSVSQCVGRAPMLRLAAFTVRRALRLAERSVLLLPDLPHCISAPPPQHSERGQPPTHAHALWSTVLGSPLCLHVPYITLQPCCTCFLIPSFSSYFFLCHLLPVVVLF